MRLAHGHICGELCWTDYTDVRRPSLRVGGKIPRIGALVWLKVEEVSQALSIQSLLSAFWLWMRCEQLLQVPAA